MDQPTVTASCDWSTGIAGSTPMIVAYATIALSIGVTLHASQMKGEVPWGTARANASNKPDEGNGLGRRMPLGPTAENANFSGAFTFILLNSVVWEFLFEFCKTVRSATSRMS